MRSRGGQFIRWVLAAPVPQTDGGGANIKKTVGPVHHTKSPEMGGGGQRHRKTVGTDVKWVSIQNSTRDNTVAR